mgnify:CR=1 FL=1
MSEEGKALTINEWSIGVVVIAHLAIFLSGEVYIGIELRINWSGYHLLVCASQNRRSQLRCLFGASATSLPRCKSPVPRPDLPPTFNTDA